MVGTKAIVAAVRAQGGNRFGERDRITDDLHRLGGSDRGWRGGP